MTERLDEHFRLARDVRAEDRLRQALALVRDAGIRAVVEGGWAVSGHGSPVESVDVDLLIHSSEYASLHEAALRRKVQLDARASAEALGLDLRYLDEFNALFGARRLGYAPQTLLRNRVRTVAVRTARGSVRFRAPNPAALVAMKLKAFHDRRKQWETKRDPRRMVWLDQDEADFVRSRDLGYWERKAGKDLFDVGFLLQNVRGAAKALAILDPEVREAIVGALTDVPDVLAAFAEGMGERARVEAVAPNEIKAHVLP